MAGGVFAGVLGPQLVQWTMDIWPPDPFAFSFCGGRLWSRWWRWRCSRASTRRSPAASDLHGGRPLFEIARQPRFIAAALCGVITYPMMNLVMTSAPLAMKMCGLSVSDSNFGIQWHIVAMYGPSFFTGSLIARFGGNRHRCGGPVARGRRSYDRFVRDHRDAFLGHPDGARDGWNFGFCRRFRAGPGDAPAAGAQQGAGLQRFPGVRDDGGPAAPHPASCSPITAGTPSIGWCSRRCCWVLRCCHWRRLPSAAPPCRRSTNFQTTASDRSVQASA